MEAKETIACYRAEPYSWEEARRLADALDLAEPVAITLVRRGYRDIEDARRFLAAEERHDPFAFARMDEIAESVAEAAADGRRITIHGDYDVDGMSSTAILVSALRARGAECDWLIPDRQGDGYGLSPATVHRLVERGTQLLITADCGIACPEEVALARESGMDVIVTDHHQPKADGPLPDCPIVHPGVSGYPFEGLCGAAVAFKLVEAITAVDGFEAEDGSGGDRDLDLVALATIADLVPLIGENRTLTRLGLAELRRARRPGIRALAAAAKVEPEHLDEGDVAFRIAPRLNAAGRLYRADAGVELMLTRDASRASAISAELDSANHERREIEREVYAAAEAARRELPEDERNADGLVLAGEEWHPGVVGIAASRVAERHGKPSILLSIGADGVAKGSGRSVPGFDLLGALEECAGHLTRFGGHRAAAGVELAAAEIPAFRRAFIAAAEEGMAAAAEEFPAGEEVDAVVGAESLELRTAEQLRDLGPFGQGNPAVRLLVPWASVGDIRPMGAEGRHARFNLSSGGARAGGVAFNSNGVLASAAAARSDLRVRLELNHWNGAVEPRAVLAGATGTEAGGPDEVAGGPGCGCGRAVDTDWWSRFETELARDPGTQDPASAGRAGTDRRREIEHRARSAVALLAELLTSGDGVTVVVADARRRSGLAEAAARSGRFGSTTTIACGECAATQAQAAAERGPLDLVLADWDALAGHPELATGSRHLVVIDPPEDPGMWEVARSTGTGLLHRLTASAGDLPERCLAERWQPRNALAAIYRGLGTTGKDGEPLGELLAGDGPHRREAVVAARSVKVLLELGITALSGAAGGDRSLRVVSSEKTALERSGAWRAYTEKYEAGLRSLQSPKQS